MRAKKAKAINRLAGVVSNTHQDIGYKSYARQLKKRLKGVPVKLIRAEIGRVEGLVELSKKQSDGNIK